MRAPPKGREGTLSSSSAAWGGSLFLIRLPLRAGRGKGIELHAALVDPHNRRIGRQIKAVPSGIEHLRDQRDVGEPRYVAMTENAGAGIAGQQLLKCAKANVDPVIVPGRDHRLVMPERPLQIA